MGVLSMNTVIKSVIGSLSICLGTYFSLVVDDDIISPIVFSSGILLVIYFNLNLITKDIPTAIANTEDGSKKYTIVPILIFNLLTAFIVGKIMSYDFELYTNATINNSILGGAVIGIVSLIAMENYDYKELLIMLLMFCFVYLKLPHCVVYAFYGGLEVQILKSLPIVVLGNIIGGSIVGLMHRAVTRL